jgi:transcriptional regulator with XRE-family HTH domain
MTRSKSNSRDKRASAAARGASKDVVVRSASGLRRRLRMTQAEFARLLGVSVRQVSGIESGKPLSPRDERALSEVLELVAALEEIMPAELVGDWLARPNEEFRKLKPLELVERGESGKLWRMIHLVGTGEPF